MAKEGNTQHCHKVNRMTTTQLKHKLVELKNNGNGLLSSWAICMMRALCHGKHTHELWIRSELGYEGKL